MKNVVSHVYVITGVINGKLAVKIGATSDTVESRLKAANAHVPGAELIYQREVICDPRIPESMVQQYFKPKRVEFIAANRKKPKEWFRVTINEAIDRVDSFCDMINKTPQLAGYFAIMPRAENLNAMMRKVRKTGVTVNRVLIIDDRAGELVKTVRDAYPNAAIVQRTTLQAVPGIQQIDLEKGEISLPEKFFDLIVTNPPFSNGVVAKNGKKNGGNTEYWMHAVRFAARHLKEGGVMGLIAPAKPKHNLHNFDVVDFKDIKFSGGRYAAMSIVAVRKEGDVGKVSFKAFDAFPRILLASSGSKVKGGAYVALTNSDAPRISIDLGQNWQKCSFFENREISGNSHLMVYGTPEDLRLFEASWKRNKPEIVRVFGDGQLTLTALAELFGAHYLNSLKKDPAARKFFSELSGVKL